MLLLLLRLVRNEALSSIQDTNFNPSTRCVRKKVIRTQTNLQLSELFKNV